MVCHPIKIFLPVLVAAMLAAPVSEAQTKPFPHAAAYVGGFLPATVTSNDALASYTAWKVSYLKSDCGNGTYRVEFGSPTGSTVSEGMGYGMVLTAYFGDKVQFDGLWKFVQQNFSPNVGLMGWKVTCSGFVTAEGGAGTATDGDTDIGLALVAAVDQWGDAYRQIALDYLATLKKMDFANCTPSGRILAKAGNWGGGCDFSNTSYWMPGYYRVFQQFTGDPFWGKAADDAIAIYQVGRNTTTGLIANEVDQNGAAHGASVVNYNGCRTPWRMVTDYLWYGTAGAKDITDKMTDWANSIGISKLVDGYNTNGTPTGQYTQQNPWVGGWACGSMSRSQPIADSFASDLKSIANTEGGYYGSSLRSLYLLMLTGNFWKPEAVATAGGPSSGATTGGPSSGATSGAAPSSGMAGQTSGASATAPMPIHGGACGCSNAPKLPRTVGVTTFLALLGIVARRRFSLRRRAKPLA
jgi:hypothetical protein